MPTWKHFEYILYAVKSRQADMFSSKLPVSQVYLRNLWKLLTRLIRTPRPDWDLILYISAVFKCMKKTSSINRRQMKMTKHFHSKSLLLTINRHLKNYAALVINGLIFPCVTCLCVCVRYQNYCHIVVLD